MTGGRDSSLRTRLLALVLAAMAALIAIAVAAAVVRENDARAAVGEMMRDNLRLAWREAMNQTAGALAGEAHAILADFDTVDAMNMGDATQLSSALAPYLHRLRERFGSGRVEVLSGTGRTVFNSGGEFVWRPILGAEAVAHVLEGDALDVLQTDWTRSVVAVHAAAVGADLVLTVSAGVAPTLKQLAQAVGGEVMIVNRRGRLLAGTAPDLWQALDDGNPDMHWVEVDGRVLAVVSLPLSYPDGLTARLVSTRDVTELATRRSRTQAWSLGLAALGVLAVAVGLWVWLKRMFAPLAVAVGALRALSAGDTSVVVDSGGRDDEIGRMAQAVDSFRDRMARLARLDRAQKNQRRRQERFIHHEMNTLAGTLDELARDEILRDLAEIEKGGGDEEPGDLGMMARALHKMSLRVRQQQQHLQQLVDDLTEALKMKAAYFQLQQELDIARQIQLSMLPVDFPRDNPRVELHARMHPAKEVGGDFYDFFFIDDDRLGVVIADVSGKGVPAALFMAISRTLLKATALFGATPARCLANLNNLLVENNEKDLFVTVFYGILDLRSGELSYCNAGHNPPLLLHADGRTSVLPRTKGAALAMFLDMPQKDGAIQLGNGDLLFLFTDGVTEAQDVQGQLFGDPRLVQVLSTLAGQDPATVIEEINRAVADFAAEAPQFDDITCLAARWKPTP